ESNFHSFPSGHSSTIFIVCFILASVLPKLKYFFYFLASIIAFSRVIVSAHFFTDIVAGAILALILFKVLNKLIENKYNKYKFSNLIPEKNSGVFYYILILFFLLCICDCGSILRFICIIFVL
ncbi:phosphatase PAP2 family protein, partial [Pelagibacteraceae bacterium]|nr:phosphatase PAP2 family protein [Pelagibacteraceae bacterium]